MTSWLADDIRAMAAPFGTYRRLLAGPLPAGPRALLARPALMALVLGGFVTLGNAGQLLPTLLIGSVASWSWVPALQMSIATGLILLVRRRTVRLTSALDLFFLGHAPWSLFLLVLTGVMMAQLPDGGGMYNPRLLILVALVPIGWTCLLIFAFCRTVLALTPGLALLWMVLYQAAIWGVAYLYLGATTYRVSPFSLYPAWLP
jgi:hypothetical protein